ncbi:MAG: glutamate synthase large subunit [Clostridia bacterium]|nr:glutamate synthase large subunit [Clostridia bacterium]MBQ6383559.1 glutamate synthase large subunit [Clostridia bacterium]
MKDRQYPLYHEELEHESCGVGAVADLSGRATHRTVDQALCIVERLAHRAGSDALGTTGDGVGILTQLPHSLFSAWAREEGISLGQPGDYGVGMFFLPEDEVGAENACLIFEQLAAAERIAVLGWRNVPCHPAQLGAGARRTMPRIRQCFVRRPEDAAAGAEFDRRLYVLRRVFEKQNTDTFICSLSCRTVVYKGMMLVGQLRSFYDDLQDARYTSAMAMVHSRFSTNTFPSWSKAHPHRMLLHNGEINTIRGNHDRMKAREETMRSEVMGAEMRRVLPVVEDSGSDSQMLDNALEFLVMNGFPLPLAGMVLLPEPYQGMRQQKPWHDLYRYYATMMEPWDGPAAVLYSDGEKVCASLDRNGLRPLRCALTDDRRLILSSEAGVLFEENAHIIRRWKLGGGDVLEADLTTGRLIENDELKTRYAREYPYTEWMRGTVRLADLPENGETAEPLTGGCLARLCRAFRYTQEDLQDILRPMAENGTEPIVSMGADEPLAALSKTHPPLFDYFRQRFAQVTNPPIDALREEVKTDCSILIGDDGNLLSRDPENCVVLELPSPVLTEEELGRIRALQHPAFTVRTVSLLYKKEETLRDAMDELYAACDRACRDRINVLILSDRGVDTEHPAIPSLLAVSALEQHLIRIRKRTAVSVVLESGEPRDVHQLALLVAFGARAVNPYLAHDCVRALCAAGQIAKAAPEALAAYDRALTAGVLKIASKMGVSTLQAYQSAQLFEAVGLDRAFVDKYFTNTPACLGGTDLNRVEADLLFHHRAAFADPAENGLPSVGIHRLRTGEGAEEHLYSPETIHLLQQAVWTDSRETFDRYAAGVEQEGPRTIRSMLTFRYEACREIPLSEVESAASIVKRFRTGAMSYGSISQEAHECLAKAMNHLGGRSNSGEGGELPERFGTELNSAIKQVASGRFGVTRDYLLSAQEIQIKMAQGAKPGEGGHLPGAKVTESVAKTRCSTPGISLISPPPHHDIYSIEDLAELIYDLQCANEQAKITVKLVASTGVGTIASGVAKAGAGGILISGGEGGTGAVPLSSVHHAGLPWEIGLAEAHQVLCRNRLRQQVTLETDGKLMTGHDVAVALLLGAEQFGFATAPLVTMGCRMMRVCHLGTCPFGIATQNPELRRRFAGKPEYVERFMLFIAEQLREIMAKLGARTVSELVGRSDLLKMKPDAAMDLSDLIGFARNTCFRPEAKHDFRLQERTDVRLFQDHVQLMTTDRAFGTMLKGNRTIQALGCGGQSFGAFLPAGQTITLYGVANDYLGKGLSGGTLAVCPPADAIWRPEDTLIGNVALYGATGGCAFVAGRTGERFAVRNSGAWAVAEGVGDHGCEYMTGGRVAVLGSVGDNFAAGMSGGIAWVLDEDGTLAEKLNTGHVQAYPVSPEEAEELERLLRMHERATGSRKAREILERFADYLPLFRTVISDEYKARLKGA